MGGVEKRLPFFLAPSPFLYAVLSFGEARKDLWFTKVFLTNGAGDLIL